MKTKNTMTPKAFVTDIERQRWLFIERYMQLKRNFTYNSGNEKYTWLEDSKKNRYSCGVNVNNWLEERHDINYIKNNRQSLNDFEHAYKSEYKTCFGGSLSTSTNGKAFPGHQPQLDPPSLKKVYNSYESTSRADFQDPRSIMTSQVQCKYCRLRMERARNLQNLN